MESQPNFLIQWKTQTLLGKCKTTYTKQVKQIRHLCYSERLRSLNLPTRRYRRHPGDMIEVFKILHNICDSENTAGIVELSNNTIRRGHSLKLSAQPSRLEIRRTSFAVGVIKPWNSLPEELIMSPSVYKHLTHDYRQVLEQSTCEVLLQRTAPSLKQWSGHRGSCPASRILGWWWWHPIVFRQLNKTNQQTFVDNV